jgi:hypothetical protein
MHFFVFFVSFVSFVFQDGEFLRAVRALRDADLEEMTERERLILGATPMLVENIHYAHPIRGGA